MSATLSAGIDSLTLKIKTPMESDGVTPRDDLIGVKVWYSTTTGFTPPTQGILAYDGTGLDISITGLTSGTLYYVRYALISEIEPDYYTLSDQLSATPVYETQTVDATPPPTPTGVTVTAGVGTVFISHDNPTYSMGRGHKKTHVFGLKTTAANTVAGYTFANASAAGEIGQFTGNSWSFSSDPDTEWHIWLKWETNNGVLSNTASGGATGNTAKTSQDVSTLLSALTGKITTGQLNTALNNNLTNLNSQYVIKVGAAGQVAGFGIASTATDSGNATSEFGIQADKFWIAPPAVAQATAPTTNLYRGYVWIDTSVPATPVTKYYTGSAWSTTRQTVLPFAVVTTPENINGQTVNPGVYIDAAYIKDGTITNAKIGDATITAAKIGSVDATKITVNQLTASQINSNGLSIRDSAGNLLLDASNSQLGVSLYVGTGSSKRLLSTVGAFASTPTTAYIGEFSSDPTFTANKPIQVWTRDAGITTITTSAAHGFVLGTKVTVANSTATLNGTYEIIEIPTTTTFKIVNAGTNGTGTAGNVTGYLYAENSVYKNTTDNNSYILTGSTLAWSLFIQKGYTPVKGTDYVDGLNPPVFLITGDGIFTKLKNLSVTPSTITLTTGYQNLTGTLTYKWYKNDTVISGATSSSYAVPVADFVTSGTTTATANTYKCEITGTYNAASTTLTASKVVNLLTEGDDSLTVVVTNPNPIFSAPASGYSGIDFSNGACDVSFYYGSTRLLNYGTGTYRFNLTVVPTRVNATGNTTGGSGATSYVSTIAAPTAMTADTAYIDLSYNVFYAGKSTTIPVRVNYTLARQGAKGADSTTAGPRGSTWAYISGRTSWDDGVANTYFTNNFADIKVINDTVTEYGTNFSETRVWNGSSWIKVSVAIDGNLLVKGTVTADAVATGTVIVGSTIKSADEKFIIDFANKYISITV